MTTREGRAPLARRVVVYGAVGLAAIAGVAIWTGTASHRGADATHASADAAALGGANPALSQPALPASAGLPPPLAGSSAPRLPLDTGGHLAKSRAVRDFFDYCLTARSDLSAPALDALVVREIAAQLDGTVAQSEALDVWHRYRAYLDALAKLPEAGAVDKSDLGALQLALDQRASIAYRTLGDWSQPFFGTEQWRQRYDLARLKITQDPALTEAQKAERLAALAQQMPADKRAARQKADRQQATIDQIAQLRKSGATPDAMRAQLTQTLGPEAAARVAQMQQEDASWQSRYADYAAQRAQIGAAGLSPQDRDAQIAALRQRMFTKPGEALRAASLDRGAAAAQ
ncbi:MULTISPECIES: lipase secretion chaperone [unclassified Burkholderia]|uniref:lipase secretion chaperone n=1 Tax=unclassified Burkholderia TaxID=2613784 RepID=UPI000F573C0A|nr:MULTISPECIES: lipase secretion chaperone [unclassified Burkholderia]RQR94950.1 lipase secretion chaperone [Burkholderia sp. Bp8994]RQS29316.1 lipase secretion chaperone [Burkholderia sp. Bp8995]RQS47562.1 lipase secretion chaperone [Burkholderia sp. Bp8989]